MPYRAASAHRIVALLGHGELVRRVATTSQPSPTTLGNARLDRALLCGDPGRAQQLLPQRLDLALDFVLRRILVLELVPQLEALDLNRPLALVVEDRRVRLPVLDRRVSVVVERLELVARPQVRELASSEDSGRGRGRTLRWM